MYSLSQVPSALLLYVQVVFKTYVKIVDFVVEYFEAFLQFPDATLRFSHYIHDFRQPTIDFIIAIVNITNLLNNKLGSVSFKSDL